MTKKKEISLTCRKCGEAKPYTQFYKNKTNSSGYGYNCKQCECLRLRNVYTKSDAQKRARAKYDKTDMARYNRLKSNAKKRETEFLLDKLEFIMWFRNQEKVCYYCNIALNTNGNTRGQMSIDRKDNELGYSMDNIALSCQSCNTIKGNTFTENEMLEIAERYIKPKLEVYSG